VIPGIGKTIPVFNLASNHQWNVTLSDVEDKDFSFYKVSLELEVRRIGASRNRLKADTSDAYHHVGCNGEESQQSHRAEKHDTVY
jgi:hypothetical protein